MHDGNPRSTTSSSPPFSPKMAELRQLKYSVELALLNLLQLLQLIPVAAWRLIGGIGGIRSPPIT